MDGAYRCRCGFQRSHFRRVLCRGNGFVERHGWRRGQKRMELLGPHSGYGPAGVCPCCHCVTGKGPHPLILMKPQVCTFIAHMKTILSTSSRSPPHPFIPPTQVYTCIAHTKRLMNNTVLSLTRFLVDRCCFISHCVTPEHTKPTNPDQSHHQHARKKERSHVAYQYQLCALMNQGEVLCMAGLCVRVFHKS